MTNTGALSNSFFCSDCSREAGEQRFGTAPVADVWLALEYSGPWTKKAVTDNDLPEAVRTYLNAGLDGQRVRPLLIRQHGSSQRGFRFFVAVADECEPRLYAFGLETYDNMLAIDLADVLAGAPQYDAHRCAEPLYLICTNGRRDRACARYGLPLYLEMARQAGDAVWQTTHLGGHRFAATTLFLPHGIAYGHLDPHDAVAAVAAYRAGELDLAHLRGRSCYSQPVQAAEYYLRSATGNTALHGYRLIGEIEEQPARWVVRFEALADGCVHEVRLAADRARVEVYLSSADSSPELVPQYELVGYAVLA